LYLKTNAKGLTTISFPFKIIPYIYPINYLPMSARSFKLISILAVSCLFYETGKAQYVTIPDTAFVSWLQNPANGFSACMNGNQMDTTCSAIVNATALLCYAHPIRDLTGVQYFKNITRLDCSNDSLSFIPSFPATVTHINCQVNLLDSLPLLPTNLNDLN
jgi:hypothetical protein